MGISQNAMARAIGVAPRAINEIIHSRLTRIPQKKPPPTEAPEHHPLL